MVEPLTFVSLGVGAWGAGVATVLGVRQVLHDRRSLKVTCRWGVGGTDDTGKPERIVLVHAVNEGTRPVEVRVVTFRFEDGKPMLALTTPDSDPFNKLLGDGRGASYRYVKRSLDEAEQAAQVPIAYAVVEDASGNEYVAPYER